LQHGALLFRGFGAGSASWFERAAGSLCAELYAEYGDLPREQVGGRVYGSTPYPSEQRIEFHHESSHLPRWPRKIFFHCVQAAPVGGETPLADGRRVLGLLPAALRDKFAERGLLYVRCFREGLDVSWQDFFRVSERSAVEAACGAEGLMVQWLGDGTLRTERRAEAVRRHPETGDAVFFNQILLHHAACLPEAVRGSLLALYGAEGLPRQVYFGDGGAISDAELAQVAKAYEQATLRFPWQPGDLLMVDNMRVAHGRSPFSGPRKILVAMGDMTGEGTA